MINTCRWQISKGMHIVLQIKYYSQLTLFGGLCSFGFQNYIRILGFMDLPQYRIEGLNHCVGWWFKNLFLLVSNLNFSTSRLNRFGDATIQGVDHCCGGSFIKITRDFRIFMVCLKITTLHILTLVHQPHLFITKSRIFFLFEAHYCQHCHHESYQ